jgi:glycogen debranching enzyme
VKVNGGDTKARRQAGEWLAPLQEHLSQAGLGHIAEIFEGDPPHRPCGCIAQAWSVAEVLRAYVEDVKGIKPKAHPEGLPRTATDASFGDPSFPQVEESSRLAAPSSKDIVRGNVKKILASG